MSTFMKQQGRHRLVVVIALIVVLALGLPALAAPVEVDFWSLLTGGDGDVMNAIIDRFNAEHEDIIVTHSILDWGDPYYSRLITSMVAGAPPAIGIMHDSRLKSFAEQGLLTPFTEKELELMGVDGSDFIPAIWDWALFEGVNYAIPLDIHPHALYINVPMFEQSGLAPRAPQSAEEFIQYTNLLKRDFDGSGILNIAGYAGYGTREWLSFFAQYGGELLDENGQPNVINDAGRIGLEFQRDLIRANSDQIFGWFGDETSAMQMLGPWEIGNFQQLGIDFITTEVPQIGPQPGTWAGSHLLVIPNGIKENRPEAYEAALTFISWLSANSIEWSQGAGHVPARIDRLTLESFMRLEAQQAFARSLDYSVFWPDHRLEPDLHVEAAWPYLTDQITVNDALERMELVMRRILFE